MTGPRLWGPTAFVDDESDPGSWRRALADRAESFLDDGAAEALGPDDELPREVEDGGEMSP